MARIADRTFRSSPHGLLVAVVLSVFISAGCSGWESFRQRTDAMKHDWFDDGWDDPKANEHMVRGEQLFEERSYEKAIKELKQVADNKNNNTEVAERARFLQAESRRLLGQYPEAVDTYHRLLIDFPTGSHRREACTRMYEIADYWLGDFKLEIERRSGEKGILRWSPGWPNPLDKTKPAIDQEGRALEAMENIHTQDVTGPLADKALFWCGYVNFVRGDFQKADRYFSELVQMHHESPLRPQATAYAIQAKNNATGGAIYDGRKCAEALQLIHVAEATMPELTQDREMADKLTRAKFAIRSQQAEKDFRMAEYYERTGHPGSAVFYYELVRRRFSGTRYADIATEKKEYLLTLMKEGHPAMGNDPVAIAKAKWESMVGKKPPLPNNQPQGAPALTNPVSQAGGVGPGGGIVPGAAPSGVPSAGVMPSNSPPYNPAAPPSGSVPGAPMTSLPIGATQGGSVMGLPMTGAPSSVMPLPAMPSASVTPSGPYSGPIMPTPPPSGTSPWVAPTPIAPPAATAGSSPSVIPGPLSPIPPVTGAPVSVIPVTAAPADSGAVRWGPPVAPPASTNSTGSPVFYPQSQPRP